MFTLQENFFKQQERHTKHMGKRLSNEKELLRKKAIQDKEKQRLTDGERERTQEAQKLEERRLNLLETEKELTK